MASRTGDVSESVHGVVAAYDKAINLVRRIEDRKDDKNDIEAVHDLYKSLALGPTIVQGCFDADSKRLGLSYLIGDFTAGNQLRDVLLNLRILIGDLQDVLLDDKETDFKQLQNVSDNCRVNSAVCLGQLSRRLTDAQDPSRMHFQNPPAYMSGPSPVSPGLHYSDSQSTHSSSRGRILVTPEAHASQQNFSPLWQSKIPDSDDTYFLQHQRKNTDVSLQEHYGHLSGVIRGFAEREDDAVSLRRPSSHTLGLDDNPLSSPGLPPDSPRPQVLPGQQDLNRDSYNSLQQNDSVQTLARQATRDRYGPDDFTPIEQYGPFPLDRSSAASITSCANRTNENHHSTLEPATNLGHSAQPPPLHLPHRPARQPARTFSQENETPPPRKPLPLVPYKQYTGHAAIDKHHEVPVPNHVYGQRVPIPPRSQSRHNASETATLQGPLFQSSSAVQRAMQSTELRRQYTIDRSPQFELQQPDRQAPSDALSRGLNQTPSNVSLSNLPQPPLVNAGSPMTSSPAALTTKQQQNSMTLQSMARGPLQSVKPLSSISVTSIAIARNLPLNLPTDMSFHPFCKGAFRLFVGLTKKAMVVANRPVGISSFIPYWRCDKCLFEGPMHFSSQKTLDKKGRPTGKQEKIFDPAIRECGPITSIPAGPDGRGEGSGGIRYKWAFLAKCHVPLKSSPEGKAQLEGSFGSFACMFCVAEGAGRGWNVPSPAAQSTASLGFNGPGVNDATSVRPGKPENSAGSSRVGANAPIFGNLQSFMDHLQMHRRPEGMPGAEMQGRMRCIVGREAGRGDGDWEVNFVPLS